MVFTFFASQKYFLHNLLRSQVIAEYNKELGEKLKCEVEERDETINKLQKSMEVINNAHIENTKDKLALCMELKEVCSIKDQLNNNLDVELQKSSSLGQSKKELENATNSKVFSWKCVSVIAENVICKIS